VEAILLGSFGAYQEQFGILPRLIEMDDSFIYGHDPDGVEEDRESKYIETLFFTINVEPLRFLYAGFGNPMILLHVSTSIVYLSILLFSRISMELGN